MKVVLNSLGIMKGFIFSISMNSSFSAFQLDWNAEVSFDVFRFLLYICARIVVFSEYLYHCILVPSLSATLLLNSYRLWCNFLICHFIASYVKSN